MAGWCIVQVVFGLRRKSSLSIKYICDVMRRMKETVVSFLLLGPMISIAAGQSLPTKKEAELFLQKLGKLPICEPMTRHRFT
jgi:hypothetical protein